MELIEVNIFRGVFSEKPKFTFNINIEKKKQEKPWLKNSKNKKHKKERKK